jgi:hypothetical protein
MDNNSVITPEMLEVSRFQRTSAIIVNDTYSYINNSLFYALANKTFYDYYNNVVRRCASWLDGYVIGFHNAQNGIFSTRLAASLVKGIGNQIVGRKILFKQGKATISEQANIKETKSSIDFISNEWSPESGFHESVREAIKFSVGLGASLLKLNKSGKDLWIEALRLDSFFFESDFRGRLVDVTCLIKNYANVKSANGHSDVDNYYLVEHRYFKFVKRKEVKEINGEKQVFEWIERVPKVAYQVKKNSGTTLSNRVFNPSMSEEVRWDSLPANIKTAIKKDYAVIEIGKEQFLPFVDHLGCELLRNDGSDITLPQTPFGTSILQDIISDLMTYDLAYSWYVRDMYQGKGMVIIPKPMSMNNMGGNQSPFSGLDKSLFEAYESTDPDKQKPVNVQFELRAQEWHSIQDNILKKIATKIGMSPKTIASYLDDSGGQKTATEIDAEDDSTIAFIEIKRSIFEKPINRILKLVTDFYGFVDKVEVKFATPSLVNQDKIIDRAIKLYNSGLADEEEALKMVYPDDDNTQIKERIEKMKQRIEEKKLQLANDPFGIG